MVQQRLADTIHGPSVKMSSITEQKNLGRRLIVRFLGPTYSLPCQPMKEKMKIARLWYLHGHCYFRAYWQLRLHGAWLVFAEVCTCRLIPYP